MINVEKQRRKQRSQRAQAIRTQMLDRLRSHQAPAASGRTSRAWDHLDIDPQPLDRMLRKEQST